MLTNETSHFALTSGNIKRAMRKTYNMKVQTKKTTPRDTKLFESIAPVSDDVAFASLIDLANVVGIYPVRFIRDLNIKRIRIGQKFVRRPTFYHPSMPFSVIGTMDSKQGNMYLDAGFVKTTFHHEVTHQLMATMNPDLLELVTAEWEAINQRNNLTYRGFDQAYSAQSSFLPQEGFASTYAQTSLLEDIPETISSILGEPAFHLSRSAFDHALAAKSELSLRLLAATTEVIGIPEWQKNYQADLVAPPLYYLNEMHPFKYRVPSGEVRYIWVN